MCILSDFCLLVLTIPELSFIDCCAKNGNKGRVNLVLLTKRDVYKASMSENCLAVCAAIYRHPITRQQKSHSKSGFFV